MKAATYICPTCGHQSVGKAASWAHTDKSHPETIKRQEGAVAGSIVEFAPFHATVQS